MGRLQIRLLGGFELRRGEAAVVLPTRRSQALVAFLAAHAGAVQPRAELTALLWGDSAEHRARQSLRQALYSIRRVLGPDDAGAGTLRDGDGAALLVTPDDVDALAFERLVRQGSPEALERALELYRGELLEGLVVSAPAFEEWLVAERERLRELALQALARLTAHHERAGAADAAIQYASRLLTLDPLQEPAHRALMRLYDRSGRRGAALRQYARCAEVLRRELSAEPELETRALYESLLARGAPVRASAGEVTSADEGVDLPLVGRAAELAQLRAALEPARRGDGRLVLVLGESGIGKTRLTEALCDGARRDGTRVLVGRAYDLDRVLPLAPWIAALRSGGDAVGESARGLAPAWRGHLSRLLPDLVAGEPLPGSADTAAAQREAVSELVGALAALGHRLLVLEDLHWADESSVRLLAHVARHAAAWPLLIVATAREEELADVPVLGQLLRELERGKPGACLRLAPLDRGATAELVRTLVGGRARAATGARLAQRIWALGAGSPFVTVELARAWLDAPGARRARALDLPPRVRDVIAARLDRLPERCRPVLEVAAVIARAADVDVLRRAAGLEPRAAADAIDDLLARRVLAVTGERLAFAHERIRRVAYERLSIARQVVLHGAVGEALEAQGAAGDEAGWDQLAHHFDRAGRPAQAIVYLRRFAESAQRGYALDVALGALDAGLARVDGLGVAERSRARAEMLLQKAQVLSILGRFDEVFAALLPHRAEVDALGDARLAGAFHFRLAMTYANLGHHAEALETATAALGHAERAGDDRTRGLAHYVLAIHGYSAGDPRAGADHGERAAALLDGAGAMQRAGWAQWAGQAQWIRSLNQHLLGDIAGALESVGRASAIAEASGDAGLTGATAWARATIELSRGNAEEAAREAARAVAASVSHPSNRATGLGLLGRARHELGDADGAIVALEEAVQALGPFQIRQSLFAGYLAESLAARGDHARAQAEAARALTLAQRAGCPWAVAAARGELGVTLVAGGDVAGGERALREAIAGLETVPAPLEAARARLALATALGTAGRDRDAREELSAAARVFAERDAPGYRALAAARDAAMSAAG